MLYLVDPRLTGADGPVAREFLERSDRRLREFHPTSWIASPAAATGRTVGPADGVALVIGAGPLDPDVDAFLEQAATAGAVLLPVALDADHRAPPTSIGAAQSFDVTEQLRRSGHAPTRLDIAARWFAHAALARVAPTFYKDRLRLFITYRRADGEVEAADLDRELSVHHEHVFRDLIDIQVGDPAQDVIEAKLTTADVLVFIDTLRAGESDWIAKELSVALGQNIPIVWIRVGPADGRVPLAVCPAGGPQLMAGTPGAAGDLARDVLDAALDEVRLHVSATTHAFERLKSWADAAGAEVQALDQRQLIYAVSLDDGIGPYPNRRRVHIVQLYGRCPASEDWEQLRGWLGANGYLEHATGCRGFDASLLLRPGVARAQPLNEWSLVESAERYVGNLTRAEASPESVAERPSLLLLGAFPADPRTHPRVIAAVNSVCRRWLELGGAIIFGGHPTFTPLLLEVARATVGEDGAKRLTIYQSAWFTTPAFVVSLAAQATVVEVPRGDTLVASLTAMREAMIQPSRADLAVIVGGRTSEGGGHSPGVDEEWHIARQRGIPTYLLAEPGGQAAVIAERLAGAWQELGNPLSAEENEALSWSDDYLSVADRLWSVASRR